jgi:hypothetical protein
MFAHVALSLETVLDTWMMRTVNMRKKRKHGTGPDKGHGDGDRQRQ